MVWVRKGVVHLLSLVLLISLVYGAFAVSANLNLTHPDKLETWLNQSNVYGSLVTNALKDAQKSASNDVGAGRVSLSDPAVEQAVQSVFSPGLLQQYTDTFLKANYAWLDGKTAAPDFTIDLTSAKQQLAQQIGQAAQTRVAGLPACSAAQLAQLQTTLNTDPLSIACRPPSLTPQTAAQQATAQITSSRDFLNHPIITASQINPNGGKQSQPYYQKFSSAPKVYRLARKLPWIFGGLSLLSILGIIFIAPRRRKGVRRVGIVLAIAGFLLVATKFVADSAFNRLEKKLFANTNISQLQQSLTTFLHRLETQLVKVDLWSGIACLALAVAVCATLWFTRQKSGKIKSGGPQPPGAKDDTQAGEPAGQEDRPPLPVFKQPERPKRPRLIQ